MWQARKHYVHVLGSPVDLGELAHGAQPVGAGKGLERREHITQLLPCEGVGRHQAHLPITHPHPAHIPTR